MNSNQFRSVVEPILNKVFDGIYKATPNEWKPVFKVEKGIERRFQEDVVLAGTGMAALKPEGAPVAFSEGGQAYVNQYVYKTFALAIKMSQEMIEDGDHISLANIYTQHLARSMNEASEIYHADVFNNAFTNSAPFLGGDGQPLMSLVHPLFEAGQTFANMLSTPADLSEASLESLRTMIRLTPDERGFKISLKADKLVVAPENFMNATRILESTLRSGSANNDINALKFNGIVSGGIHEMSRLTNPDAYFLTTNAERGLIHVDRAPLSRGMEGDFLTGGMQYKARQRYEAKWTDPRGVFGSQGVA